MDIYGGIAFIPLISAIGQLLYKVGVKERIIPLIEFLLGIAAGMIYFAEGDFKQGFLVGTFIGLSSTGLVNATKITINGSFAHRNGKETEASQTEETSEEKPTDKK